MYSDDGTGLSTPHPAFGSIVGVAETGAADGFLVFWEKTGRDFDGDLDNGGSDTGYIYDNWNIHCRRVRDGAPFSLGFDYLYRARIAADPFVYNSEYYLTCHVTGSNNKTDVGTVGYKSAQAFLVLTRHDKFGYEQPEPKVVAKWLNAEGWNDLKRMETRASAMLNPSGNEFVFSSFSQSSEDVVGIHEVSFDFDATYSLRHERISDSTYVCPPFLRQFDGVNLIESGFHQYPENIEANADDISFSVVTQGSGGTAEKTEITVPSTGAIKLTDFWSPASFFYIYDSTDTQWTINVNISDSASSYSGAGKQITIRVSEHSTPNEVADEFVTAFNLSTEFTASIKPGTTNVVVIENTANGVATDASGALGEGVLDDGTYGYRAIYVWHDRNGNVHRSAPSAPISIALSGGAADQFVSIKVPSLQLTDKQGDFGDPIIELYRTTANGTIYYKVLNVNTSEEHVFVPNDTTREWLILRDQSVDDTELISNEILYTTGGIVENIGPPACKHLTFLKDVAMIAGIPGKPNKVWFSKRKVDGLGLSFYDGFTIDASSHGEWV
jgi:hypothetical protein